MFLLHLRRQPMEDVPVQGLVASSFINTSSLGLKLMVVGRRKPGTTLAEHRHHIRNIHGELVLRYIVTDPEHAPRRYVQNQVFDGLYRPTAPGHDPFALNRDFVTQIWTTDMAALARSRETDFYRDFLKNDEDNFVDQSTVMFMPVREREMMSRRIPANGACKLFSFIQKAQDADAQQFMRVWMSGVAALKEEAVATKICRHVQNDVMTKSGAPSLADGIDEFWLEDEVSTRALLKKWQAWLCDAMVRPGLVTETGTFALLAHEAVLYAGRH